MEKKHESRLVKGVEALGGECFKVALVSGRGFPDRSVLLHHRTLYIELKDSDRDDLSPQQKKVAARIIRTGSPYVVLHGGGAVLRMLQHFKYWEPFALKYLGIMRHKGFRVRESGEFYKLDLTGY